MAADLEGLHAKLDALNLAFEKHVSTETVWQEGISKSIEAHLHDHSVSADRWMKGAIGFFFSVLGAGAVGLWTFISSHWKG